SHFIGHDRFGRFITPSIGKRRVRGQDRGIVEPARERASALFNGDWRHEVPSCGWGMPLDVVFDVADDQYRVLLEESTVQRVGNADLFCVRFFARASHAVEQISSRLRPLPTLFTFLSRQTRARDFLPRPRSGSCWNSGVVFSFAKRAVAILLAAQILVPMFLH